MYVSSNNSQSIWIRTRSGNPMTINSGLETFAISGEWKQVKPNPGLFSTLNRLRAQVMVSYENPKVETPKGDILKSLKPSKDKINLIIDETADIDVTVEPEMELPSQLICISENLYCVSGDVNGTKVTITGHKPGTSDVILRCGNVECHTRVNVYPIPEFTKKYYEGEVGKPVDIDIVGQEEFTVTCPDGIKQEGKAVISDKAGTYDIIANILGKTISTTVKILDKEE